MSELLDRALVPVANESDAEATRRALSPYCDEIDEVVAITVIEKAGGAPDKAAVEQRELEAEDAFEVLRADWPDIETDIRYGTDVSETIVAAAEEHDTTAIVFTPRGGGRLVRLLTGDVALSMVTGSDRPVVSLPDPGRDGTEVEES
jgi:nucleotide-binding universal stress UspA family protein